LVSFLSEMSQRFTSVKKSFGWQRSKKKKKKKKKNKKKRKRKKKKNV
jgi:hypothetical protein